MMLNEPKKASLSENVRGLLQFFVAFPIAMYVSKKMGFDGLSGIWLSLVFWAVFAMAIHQIFEWFKNED